MSKTLVSADAVRGVLESFPRRRLCHLPTPLEPMERLSARLGVNLFMKRDDQTGLALGGNKARKLEYMMADVLASGADCVVTWAGMQSNWCRLLTAAAMKLGIRPVLVLFKRPGLPGEVDGNLLLDVIYGADIHVIELNPQDGKNMMDLESIREYIDPVLARERSSGHRPYLAPIGASLCAGSMHKPLGAIGYVQAFHELLQQAGEQGVDIHTVLHATGSCSTQAGLLAGAKLLSPTTRIVGVSVSESRAAMSKSVQTVTEQTLSEFRAIGNDVELSRGDVTVFDEYIRNGYGVLDRATSEAIRLAAETEGVLLDPVYTGKALVGLIDLIRQGYFRKGENVVFLHTGGAPALFAYRRDLAEHLAARAAPE